MEGKKRDSSEGGIVAPRLSRPCEDTEKGVLVPQLGIGGSNTKHMNYRMRLTMPVQAMAATIL